MVYTTGSGRFSNEQYAKMGRTFFVKTKELEEPRMMIEIDETNLQKYEVDKFNPETLKFDIPYTAKLRVSIALALSFYSKIRKPSPD